MASFHEDFLAVKQAPNMELVDGYSSAKPCCSPITVTHEKRTPQNRSSAITLPQAATKSATDRSSIHPKKSRILAAENVMKHEIR